MAKTTETTSSGRLANSFNAFLVAKKRLLIIIAAAILLAVAILWISLSVADNRAEDLQVAIDNAQRTYSEWVFLEDKSSAEGQSMRESLVEDLSQLAQKSGRSYPVLKAEYLLGLISYEEGAYNEALENFLAVSQKGSGTYLGSLALFNAGVASEQLGDHMNALEYYQRVYDTYGSDAAESAKALFSVARLHESAGNTELARAVLQQLADEFAASEYAKLARSRLVVLQ
jgi:tetratricopeptide (TPR) repeat protein